MRSIPPPESPSWGSTTKLVVGLTLVAVIAALMIRFRGIIGPLILAFIIAYLLHPVVESVMRASKITWRVAVNLVYLLLVVILAGSFTLAGLAIAQQLQSLIIFIQRFVNDLPALAAEVSNQQYFFGPFVFDFNQFDLQTLSEQILATIQPLLGRAATLISTFATSALSIIGWLLFVLLVSYFLLADAGRVSNELVHFDIPGYNADIRRLGEELRNIWNAFLRGQLILILFLILSYTVLMMALGVRYAIGIAILAGLARFVPYIGPLVAGIVTVLVAFFQPENYFGLQPFSYAVLVVVSAVILDQVFDNYVSPRFLGDRLGVHPAALLVAAIIAANLLGLIGLVLAAPVLATLQLILRYILRKMLDLDPWPETASSFVLPPRETFWVRWIQQNQERRQQARQKREAKNRSE
ncbi:MAG TPA: AI-2E family transporter [Anaerolineales bacterium]|nr:AI-2E family transporter [Anaerolineales bacterium]